MDSVGLDGAAATGSGRLSLTVRDLGSSASVALSGELDHDTADLLRQQLDRCLDDLGRVHLILDLTDLQFCDSTGLNVLLGARLRAEPRGGAVHLAAMRPAVARVFEVTGAAAVFQVHESVAEALASVPST
jgi:anti-anti-sigma factor